MSAGNGERDEFGRFQRGCKPGPGRPRAALRVQDLRSALLSAGSQEDVRRVLLVLRDLALDEGAAASIRIQAAKEYLDRLLGTPQAIDVLAEVEELRGTLARLEAQQQEGGAW